ncbi:MAG: penicillin-insensitive murein endopeptidase [Gammaproteobacteria bacterium]
MSSWLTKATLGLKVARFAANVPPQLRQGVAEAAGGAADKLSSIRESAAFDPMKLVKAMPTPAGFWIFPLLNDLGQALRGLSDPAGAEELARADDASNDPSPMGISDADATPSEANTPTPTASTSPSETAETTPSPASVSIEDVLLQIDDNDARHIWGGQLRDGITASPVADLQARLVELGYWVSHPASENGMKCDGDYGASTTGAVACFQLEHLAIDGVGTIDESKITGNMDTATREAMEAASGRPTHIATLATPDCTDSDAAPVPTPFIQLPPSHHYTRYGADYHDTDGSYRFLSARSFHFMTDNWGQVETVEMIRDVARAWVEDQGGNPFWVGDISPFRGGPMFINGENPPHGTHQFGMGVDIDSNQYCSINKPEFDPVEALKLAELFVEHGATVIYFNCHHLIVNCSKVKWAVDHHHHYHVDREFSNLGRTKTACVDCAIFPNCEQRIRTVEQRGVADSETTYDPAVHGVVYRSYGLARSTGRWYFKS